MARSAEEVLELNQILQEINIPDRDVSVKGATSKQVTYVVKSNDRDGTKSAVESLISRLGRVYNEQRSISSIPVSCVSCLLYTSPSPRDRQKSRMPSSA